MNELDEKEAEKAAEKPVEENSTEKATEKPAEEKAENSTENSTEKSTEKKEKKRVVYDEQRNNEIEEQLDTFGVWPFKSVKDAPKEKKEREGVKITKNIIVNKKGVRIAYGGGKWGCSLRVTVRRKDAVARAFIRQGTGVIRVNGKSLIDVSAVGAAEREIFPMGNNRDQVLAPLAITLTFQKFDIDATVNGGGTTGQSEAVRMAISKALAHYDPVYSVALSKGRSAWVR
mgnify:CR=1 FL=1